MITRRDLPARHRGRRRDGLLGCPPRGRLRGRAAAGDDARSRLMQMPSICVLPQYVAEDLLRAEGFTDIQYVARSNAATGIARPGRRRRRHRA